MLLASCQFLKSYFKALTTDLGEFSQVNDGWWMSVVNISFGDQ